MTQHPYPIIFQTKHEVQVSGTPSCVSGLVSAISQLPIYCVFPLCKPPSHLISLPWFEKRSVASSVSCEAMLLPFSRVLLLCERVYPSRVGIGLSHIFHHASPNLSPKYESLSALVSLLSRLVIIYNRPPLMLSILMFLRPRRALY